MGCSFDGERQDENFINKVDRPALDPLELLDEIETLLEMEPVPMNWPLGDGLHFQGVYDRAAQGVYLFERAERNECISPEVFVTVDAFMEQDILTVQRRQQFEEQIQLLDGLGINFDAGRVLSEEQTPVFFGSALTNFGVRLFLDAFVKYAPAPQPYPSNLGLIQPHSPKIAI